MLTIESVSKRFRSGTYGVRDLSLAVDGGVLGLLGPNGAGKSTLMQMIATITRPTSGRILFNGENIVERSDALRARLTYAAIAAGFLIAAQVVYAARLRREG